MYKQNYKILLMYKVCYHTNLFPQLKIGTMGKKVISFIMPTETQVINIATHMNYVKMWLILAADIKNK